MNILLAPDSFKGSLSAVNALKAMRTGIQRVSKNITTIDLPLADGGEGFVDVLVTPCKGKVLRKQVTGPLGKPVTARFGLIDNGNTAVIEMAEAAGLPLVNVRQRDPLRATTYGVGELILAAVKNGCSTIIIGAGGSATVDGGVGLLQALGVEFFDTNGKPVGRGGKELLKICSMNIEALDRFTDISFVVAADVTNPLCGRTGAARVYGPQKGADPETVNLLDTGLRHFARVIRQCYKKDTLTIPGGGAAGGMAAGLHAFLNADIVSGVDMVLGKSGFEEKLKGCDLVITGEGRTDIQTRNGKAPLGVARRARNQGIPVVCISGSLGRNIDKLYNEGFSAFFSLCSGPIDESAALADAPRLLAQAAGNVVRLYCNRK
ncbi:MAG: glycerate kinase [Chitinispirillaceae bacterium]|nr:glycerate kinase [Chitinispirillaceae bacterium]